MALPLEPGPTRDLLAKLVEARQGDEWLTTQFLAERLGWSYTVTRGRVERCVETGHAEERRVGGVPSYAGTALAEEVLRDA